MLNNPGVPLYVDMSFDENNNATVNMDKSLVCEYEDLIDFGNIRLNITNLGEFEQIPIVTTLSATGKKCKLIKIKGKWYKICTPNFHLSFNSAWEPTLYDGDGNIAEIVTIVPEKTDYETVLSIDNLSVLEAFGSHYKLIKIKGKWRVIRLPH